MAESLNEKLGGSLDGYSRIFKDRMNDGREVAVKRVITGTTDINEVNKLIELSKNAQHDNVIRYYKLEQHDPYCYIYLELCSGSLRDFVEDQSFNCGGLDKKTAVKQIALGLEHIHRNGIYHLDLKPSNVLVTCGSRKRLVLADFEVSKQVHDGKESIRTKTFGGTIGWIAPEIEYFHEFEKRLTRKADVFSFGVLVYYIWTGGSHPFSKRPKVTPDVLQEAQQGIKAYGSKASVEAASCHHSSDSSAKESGLGSKPKRLRSTSLELNMIDESLQDGVLVKDLLCNLLERTPEMRPDVGDAVKHPFFWSPHQQYQFYKQVSECTASLPSMNGKFDRSQRLRARIDQDKHKVIHGDWLRRLHPAIRRHFKSYQKPVKPRKASGPTLPGTEHASALINAIRNHWAHYPLCDAPKSRTFDLGSLPSSEEQGHTSLSLFVRNFPHLLLHTYHAALPWRDDIKLREFYPQGDFPKFQELQDDKKGLTFETNGCCLQIDATEKLVGPSEEAGALQRIWDLCISGKDELIVADNYNHRLVSMRKNGEYIGPVVTSESLNFPQNVACGHAGEIIISEPKENQVKILDRCSGESTIIKEANGTRLRKPQGIAINGEGQIFVCDSENKRIVRLDSDAGVQFDISETGSGQNESEMCLNAAFDKQDNIFVTSVTNTIHVFSKDGDFVRHIGPQISERHRFTECRGIAIYDQYIVVSDFYEDKVHVLTTAGEHVCFVDGFKRPSGIVHDRNGIFYVCDTFNCQIVKLELRLVPMVPPTTDGVPYDPNAASNVRRKSTPKQHTDTA